MVQRSVNNVEAKGESDFSPKFNDVIDAFNTINYAIFDGKLKPKWFEFEPMDTEWGYCLEGTIYLSVSFPSREFFEYIVGHEMIHLYQYRMGMKIDHGETFARLEHKLENWYNRRI